MKKIIVASAIASLFLGGCGKSQAEIEKEKQVQIEQERKLKEQAEIKATEEAVKYYLKDGESARFRNVIKNCGEVNAKNSWGAYSGFSRFIVRDDKQVNFESSDNIYFDAMVQSYCHKDYLAKFPVSNSVGKEETAVAQDALPPMSESEAEAAASEAAAAASDAMPTSEELEGDSR